MYSSSSTYGVYEGNTTAVYTATECIPERILPCLKRQFRIDSVAASRSSSSSSRSSSSGSTSHPGLVLGTWVGRSGKRSHTVAEIVSTNKWSQKVG